MASGIHTQKEDRMATPEEQREQRRLHTAYRDYPEHEMMRQFRAEYGIAPYKCDEYWADMIAEQNRAQSWYWQATYNIK